MFFCLPHCIWNSCCREVKLQLKEHQPWQPHAPCTRPSQRKMFHLLLALVLTHIVQGLAITRAHLPTEKGPSIHLRTTICTMSEFTQFELYNTNIVCCGKSSGNWCTSSARSHTPVLPALAGSTYKGCAGVVWSYMSRLVLSCMGHSSLLAMGIATELHSTSLIGTHSSFLH